MTMPIRTSRLVFRLSAAIVISQSMNSNSQQSANVIGGPACFLALHSSPVCKRRVQLAYRVQSSVYFCVLSLFLWELKIPLRTCMWLWKGLVAKCLPYLGQDIQMRYLSRMKIISCLLFSVRSLVSCNSCVFAAGVSPNSSNDSGLSNSKGFWIHSKCHISPLDNSDQSYQWVLLGESE